jgi:hypothetical protein
MSADVLTAVGWLATVLIQLIVVHRQERLQRERRKMDIDRETALQRHAYQLSREIAVLDAADLLLTDGMRLVSKYSTAVLTGRVNAILIDAIPETHEWQARVIQLLPQLEQFSEYTVAFSEHAANLGLTPGENTLASLINGCLSQFLEITALLAEPLDPEKLGSRIETCASVRALATKHVSNVRAKVVLKHMPGSHPSQ